MQKNGQNKPFDKQKKIISHQKKSLIVKKRKI